MQILRSFKYDIYLLPTGLVYIRDRPLLETCEFPCAFSAWCDALGTMHRYFFGVGRYTPNAAVNGDCAGNLRSFVSGSALLDTISTVLMWTARD